MISVLLEDKDFVIAVKPAMMPVEKDQTGAPDLLTVLGKQIGTKLYLVHRLDLPVGGVLVFAKNGKSAAILSAIVSARTMKKEYFAIAEGELADSGEYADYLKKCGNLSKIADKTDKDAKSASLSFRTLARGQYEGGTVSLVKVSLHTGRFHQIRAQFSAHGHPLLGDGKYGSHKKVPIALFSSSVAFSYHGKDVRACAYPDTDALPFSLFALESYRL